MRKYFCLVFIVLYFFNSVQAQEINENEQFFKNLFNIKDNDTGILQKINSTKNKLIPPKKSKKSSTQDDTQNIDSINNAQNLPTIKPKPTSFWGLKLTGFDFYTAGAIKKKGLSNVIASNDFNPIYNLPIGIGIIHVKRLSKHTDFYGGIEFARLSHPYSKSSGASTPTSNKDYISADVNLNIKLFPNHYVVNPFISAGIAVAYFDYSHFEAYTPIGLGIQFNLQNDVYLNASVNDKFEVTKFAYPHLTYSVGLYSPLNKINIFKRVKIVKVPPKPPKDTDRDGIIDSLDKCPLVFGFKRYKGCPIPDRDGDGINDEQDKCPSIPGLKRYRGCPIPDFDNDGINDELDSCPTIPGYARYQGCPIPDSDGDGVSDEDDLCPTVPGPIEFFGCPDYNTSLSKLSGLINFKYGKAELTDTAIFSLNKIGLMLKNVNFYLLVIKGHTDNISSRRYNLKLSLKRAEAVKKVLVKVGLDNKKIKILGHAFDFPIAPNETPENRALNRRVELKVLNSKKDTY